MILSQRILTCTLNPSPRYAGMILMSTRVRKLWKTSPRYAGMIPKSGDDFFKIISSPRYAGMIPV